MNINEELMSEEVLHTVEGKLTNRGVRIYEKDAILELENRGYGEKTETIIYACGPESMLKAVAKLAKDDQLDCVLSLEEYMACAIGGCAGCTVKVLEDGHERMKRVCVDGPVFDAEQLYF